MIRAMDAALSALGAFMTKLNVTANNIANVQRCRPIRRYGFCKSGGKRGLAPPLPGRDRGNTRIVQCRIGRRDY